MITLLSTSFWLFFLLFFVVIFVAFYIPADLFTRNIVLTRAQRVILLPVVGMVLWGVVGFISGVLQLRFALYVYVFISVLVWLRVGDKGIFKFKKNTLFKTDYIIVLLLVCGVLVQLVPSIVNGLYVANGLYFCCGVPDNLYQLALVSELVKNFPPNEPSISGVVLKNYHFLSNLIVADIVRIFRLPMMESFYQYFTFFITIEMGLSAVMFGQMITKKVVLTRWLLLFLFFSGDIIPFFLLLLGKGLHFDIFFLHDASRLWISPSRVFAIPIFFAALSFFALWLKNNNKKLGIITGVLFGSLVGIKIYFGIFALVGLLAVLLVYLFKKNYTMLSLFITAVATGLLLYIPTIQESNGFFFVGFWRFENFIMQPSFDLGLHELARLVYLAHNNFLKVGLYEFIYVIIYIFINFGTLSVAFAQNKNSFKIFPKEIVILLISGSFVSLLIGFFFLQKVGGANSSQFIITSLVIGSILAASSCSYFIHKFKIASARYMLILIVVMLTASRVLYETGFTLTRITHGAGLLIPNEQLLAYSYIQKNISSSQTMLVDNGNLQTGFSCNYINFLSGVQTFLCEGGSPGDRGLDLAKRKQIASEILGHLDTKVARKLIQEYTIDYILLASDASISTLSAGYKTVYRSKTIKIIQTR